MGTVYSRLFMSKKRMRLVLMIAMTAFSSTIVFAQSQTPELRLNTGEEIYRAACVGCHGPGGKGQPESTLGFEKPPQFPDFSDCNGSARESTYDWRATIHQGGPGRGWSDIMPSFSEALKPEQIDKVTKYLRSLCTDAKWPLGEL